MFKSEDALLARCLEYVPGECRFVVRFMTPWGPPWTDEERPAQHLGTAPFMAIQCTNEHALQRISNQFHIAIRFRWADFDRALDDSHAGQSVFEHGCQDLSKSWQRRQDRKYPQILCFQVSGPCLRNMKAQKGIGRQAILHSYSQFS